MDVLKETFNRESEDLNLVILIVSAEAGWGILGWRLNSNSLWNKVAVSVFKHDFFSPKLPFYQIYTFSLEGIKSKDVNPETIEVKWLSVYTKFSK